VGEDIGALKFNTAISQMMILMNALEKLEVIPISAYESLIRILAPFAPHLTEELWESLGNTTSIHLTEWPSYDETLLQSAQVTIAVQINGKTRDTFSTTPNTENSVLITTAKNLEKIAPWLEGKEALREVVVPNRLVNFVIAN
jgi:leucyl-tRNA synthetase